MTQLSVGDVVAGRYVIRGGPSEHPAYVAHRAFDREVEVDVALWWVRPELSRDAGFRARFLAAAEALKRTKNHHARRVFDAREVGDGVLAVVQLASEGRPHAPAAGGLADAALLDYAAGLCEGLQVAHDEGLVHGRLLPGDVATVAGLLKVGGIGLWHPAGAAARSLWGRAARYVAPEAWAATPPAPTADVYSAAIILAELACGRDAWGDSEDPRDLAEQLSLRRPELAEELIAGFAADPARRLPTPGALADALRHAIGTTQVAVRIDPSHGRGDEPSSAPGGSKAAAAGEGGGRARGARAAAADAPALPLPAPELTPPDRGEGRPSETADRAVSGSPSRARLGFDNTPATDDTTEPYDVTPPDGVAAARLDPGGEPALVGEAPPQPDSTGEPPGRDARGTAEPGPVVGAEPVEPGGAAGAVARPTVAPTPPARAAVARDPGRSPPPGGRRGLAPAALATAVAAAGITWFALGAVFGDGAGGSPAPPPEAPRAGAGSRAAAPADAASRAVVPAGAAAAGGTPAAPARPPAVVAEPLTGCPRGMVRVDAFCIDAFESPGRGRIPEVGLSLAAAARACAARGARLCAPDEWERACRGPRHYSFPYGQAYRRVCNATPGEPGAIEPAGSRPDCVSAEGVYDLSGNVAEWVAGGRARGGSAVDGTDGRCSRKRRADPDRPHGDVGYRCCADLGASPAREP